MTTSILLAVGTLLLLAAVLYVVVARPRINQWGATDQEHQATWPGDQLVARPGYVWTNAITIHAPAAQVWPWLVQLGQGRGGPVALVEPGRARVLGHIKDTDAELAAGQARSSWVFIPQPVDQHAARLLSLPRQLADGSPSRPVQFVMQRKTMLGIKQRTERNLVAATADRCITRVPMAATTDHRGPVVGLLVAESPRQR